MARRVMSSRRRPLTVDVQVEARGGAFLSTVQGFGRDPALASAEVGRNAVRASSDAPQY